jgi:hypothetical protein
MKTIDIDIEFNWNSDEAFFIIPTIEVNRNLKFVSFLWLKWSLDFNYQNTIKL